jgi:hypothetical protein
MLNFQKKTSRLHDQYTPLECHNCKIQREKCNGLGKSEETNKCEFEAQNKCLNRIFV